MLTLSYLAPGRRRIAAVLLTVHTAAASRPHTAAMGTRPQPSDPSSHPPPCAPVALAIFTAVSAWSSTLELSLVDLKNNCIPCKILSCITLKIKR